MWPHLFRRGLAPCALGPSELRPGTSAPLKAHARQVDRRQPLGPRHHHGLRHLRHLVGFNSATRFPFGALPGRVRSAGAPVVGRGRPSCLDTRLVTYMTRRVETNREAEHHLRIHENPCVNRDVHGPGGARVMPLEVYRLMCGYAQCYGWAEKRFAHHEKTWFEGFSFEGCYAKGDSEGFIHARGRISFSSCCSWFSGCNLAHDISRVMVLRAPGHPFDRAEHEET